MKIIIFDLDDTLMDTTGLLRGNYENLPNIVPFKNTVTVLESISHKKYLVTRGTQEIQNKKVDILGIRNYFEKVLVCPTHEEKKGLFQTILNENNVEDKKSVFVVGDRIDAEIRYANMLGFTTIQLKHGKYKDLKAADEFEVPNHTISDIKEVLDII